MRARFEQAIRQVGGSARLPGSEDSAFPISVQPLRVDGDGHSEIGTGFFHRFTIYTICDAVTEKLAGGSCLEYQNARYRVQSIETIYFRDEPAYRQGIIVREQEAAL